MNRICARITVGLALLLSLTNCATGHLVVFNLSMNKACPGSLVDVNWDTGDTSATATVTLPGGAGTLTAPGQFSATTSGDVVLNVSGPGYSNTYRLNLEVVSGTRTVRVVGPTSCGVVLAGTTPGVTATPHVELLDPALRISGVTRLAGENRTQLIVKYGTTTQPFMRGMRSAPFPMLHPGSTWILESPLEPTESCSGPTRPPSTLGIDVQVSCP